MRRLLILPMLLTALAACDQSLTDPIDGDGAVFVIEVLPGEQFRILLDDAGRIAEARALLESGEETTLHGVLAEGNGGFNTGYSWHLDPETVSFVDMAIELCDGRPSFVEEELEYFLESVIYYCPWGVTVVAEE